MKRIRNGILLTLILVLITLSPVSAQSYYFQVLEETVDAYFNSDGTLTMIYAYTFANQNNGSPIEFVDLGLPNSNFTLSDVSASVDGKRITDIQQADPQYLKNSQSGVTVGLGANAIQPGNIGTVQIEVRGITGVFYKYSKGETQDYASVRITPNYFGSEYVTGSTNMVVTFHLPQGVTSMSHNGSSRLPGADRLTPRLLWILKVVLPIPGGTKLQAHPQHMNFQPHSRQAICLLEQFRTGIQLSDAAISNIICGCIFLVFGGVFGLVIYASIVGAKKRSLAYLPPKIAIEGQGIKRGLTAVEAAISNGTTHG